MRFRSEKFAWISLALSLLEVLIVWGGVALGKIRPQYDWRWVGNVPLNTFRLSAAGSVIAAALGMFMDSRRFYALLAMLLALAAMGICAVPFAA
jgi:hypothetical protein